MVRFFGAPFIASVLVALYIMLIKADGLAGTWGFFTLIFAQNVLYFLIGIYTYFSIDSEIDLLTSDFATLVYTLGFAAWIISYTYTQALSQIAFGVLYFNLYELKYNKFLQEKINQIGVGE